MADYSDLVPANLRRSVSDGTRLKASITTAQYTGGTPSAANQVKPSIMYPDGTLKESIATAAGLKPSWLVAGGSAAWSPADITTLAWYDASDASTITESVGSVSQWDDKSGNARHISQGTGANQPTWNLSDEISFNGVTDYLFNSAPFMVNNGSIDVYMVCSMPSGTSNWFLTESRNALNKPLYIWGRDSTNKGRFAINGDGGSVILDSIESMGFDGSMKLVSVTDTGSLVTQALDSVDFVGDAYSRSAALFSPDRFCLGALIYNGTVASYANIGVNEMIVCGNLSSGDQSNVYDYLNAKWSIY